MFDRDTEVTVRIDGQGDLYGTVHVVTDQVLVVRTLTGTWAVTPLETIVSVIEGVPADATADEPPLERPSVDVLAPHAYVSSTSHDTQRRAAARAAVRSGTKRATVLALLGAGNFTDEEIVERLNWNPSTVRPRRLELVQMGLVIDSGARRPTIASGELAIVWTITASGREHLDRLSKAG